MTESIKRITKEKYLDYFILVARFLIGWTFLHYGYSKMTDGQFGITPTDLGTPIKDLSLFRVSWYLFDHQPFKTFIGVSQIICGALLIINRTAIIGAFMFLPIVITILIIDLSFMPPSMAISFAWRLSFYILLDLLILWHYKEKMIVIWNSIGKNVSTKFKYPIWAYLIIPIAAIGFEIVFMFFRLVTNLIAYPAKTIEGILKIPELIIESLK